MHAITGGAAVGTHTRYFNGRLSVGQDHGWYNLPTGTYPFDYSGQRSVMDLRLDLNVNTKPLAKKHPRTAQFWLNAGYNPMGYISVPNTTGTGTGDSYESLQHGWDARLTFQMPFLKPVRPWVTLGGSQYYQGLLKPVSQGYAEVGFNTRVGRWSTRYTYTNNPILRSGQGDHAHQWSATWQGPDSWNSGWKRYLRPFSLEVVVNNADGRTNGGVLLHYNFLDLLPITKSN
jgi:hypothetical protein